MAFIFTWTEERISWNQSEFGYQTSIYMAPEDIWRPRLFVQESYDTLIEVGNISGMVKVGSNGRVQWTVGTVIKVTCSVDVTYFPFDSQTCIITLTALPYTSEELWLYGMNVSLDTSLMKKNSQWTFVEGTLANQSNQMDLSHLSIRLKFKRRSEYYIVYIIIPLVFLGGINNLVFFMPANTGERSSMAVTIFLSVVVFMQIVNSSVPQSSMPIAYIFYYLMFLLLYSSGIMLFCIISVYLYAKEGHVSTFWKCFVIVLRCRCFRKRQKQSNKVVGVQDTSDKRDNGDNLQDNPVIAVTTVNVSSDTDNITWTDVGKTFDTYISTMNFLVYWVFSAAVFMSLYTNSGIYPSHLN
jgi:hypothetical protein